MQRRNITKRMGKEPEGSQATSEASKVYSCVKAKVVKVKVTRIGNSKENSISKHLGKSVSKRMAPNKLMSGGFRSSNDYTAHLCLAPKRPRLQPNHRKTRGVDLFEVKDELLKEPLSGWFSDNETSSDFSASGSATSNDSGKIADEATYSPSLSLGFTSSSSPRDITMSSGLFPRAVQSNSSRVSRKAGISSK
mmetsp:Transcript_16013/g.28744  ORF Transcript_16013/g.28744 Transcript_16013/m.28744 type:complete len:193 (+) Transcript_16013:191-769(+)